MLHRLGALDAPQFFAFYDRPCADVLVYLHVAAVHAAREAVRRALQSARS